MTSPEIKMLVATDPTGIIGVNGKLPWYYKADLKRFKKITMGGTLIMGHSTWESLPGALPGRNNFVLTRKPLDEVVTRHNKDACEWFPNFDAALAKATALGLPVWICGGAQIYAQAFPLVCGVDLTIVPLVTPQEAVEVTYFPPMPPEFQLVSEEQNAEAPEITHKWYARA